MDEDAKTELLRSIPYGLYVATTRGPDGTDHAFLLSWVTQSSFDPPLLVCCVNADSSGYQHLTEGHPHMVVNLLGEDQKPLATTVLQADQEDPFLDGEPTKEAANGCAIVPSTLGALEVEVLDRVDRGDHAVFVTEVAQAHAFREGEPLTHEATGWTYAG
jgi:flavin reductase (DIM6/NTAB) family NADH-FMN oxidoreductase RutF